MLTVRSSCLSTRGMEMTCLLASFAVIAAATVDHPQFLLQIVGFARADIPEILVDFVPDAWLVMHLDALLTAMHLLLPIRWCMLLVVQALCRPAIAVHAGGHSRCVCVLYMQYVLYLRCVMRVVGCTCCVCIVRNVCYVCYLCYMCSMCCVYAMCAKCVLCTCCTLCNYVVCVLCGPRGVCCVLCSFSDACSGSCAGAFLFPLSAILSLPVHLGAPPSPSFLLRLVAPRLSPIPPTLYL